MKTVRAESIKTRLTDGKELAILDVREDGQFGEGHLLHAVSLPYSRLELNVAALIPRVDVPVFVVDDGNGNGVAEKAALRLEAMGYSDVSILDGDLASCVAAGFTLFKGENVPSKTLGELAEEVGQLPSINAEEMKRMLDQDDDYILLDGRTPREFNNMSIPSGRSCPNAELGYRLPLLVSNPKTKVIVNCAGRTRSLVGAQSLRNMGFENPIFALKDGTQGWRLAGFNLDHGRTPEPLPEVTGKLFDATKARAATFMRENNIPTVGAQAVADWISDDTRTLYMFDVRTEEEYAAHHLSGAIFAPGGQLVQGADKWVAVRGARIVLCDDANIRAANTAYWLRGMGHDAYVLLDDVSDPSLNLPTLKQAAPPISETLDVITARDLAATALVPTIIDLRASVAYREAHIAGAIWSIRPKLETLNLEADASVVFVAPDHGLAELAAIDLRDAGIRNFRILGGGMDDWRVGGLEVVATPEVPSDAERIDFLFFVHDRHLGNPKASQEYLNWELGLIGQLKEWELSLFPIHDGHG